LYKRNTQYKAEATTGVLYIVSQKIAP